MTRSMFALAAAALATGASSGQGTITSGDCVFEWVFFDPLGPVVDFSADAGVTDHAYQVGWFIRLPGSAQEIALGAPDTQVYAGNWAMQTYQVDDLLIEVISTLFDGFDPNQAVLEQEVWVTNSGQVAEPLSLFHYADLDLGGGSSGDSAVLVDPNLIRITDAGGDSSEYTGLYFPGRPVPVAHQVEPFSDLRDALTDALLTDLTSSGLPFGPGDFTGAWQWDESVAPDIGEVMVAGMRLSINDRTRYCTADVNDDGAVTLADFTAWIAAFHTQSSPCDQNFDGACTPTDFTAWIANYNAGC